MGALRLLAPQPPQAWSGVRDATQFGAACPQKVLGSMKSLGPALFVNFGEALGDDRIDTNIGLRDQLVALRWVRDNIMNRRDQVIDDPERERRLIWAGQDAGPGLSG